MKKLVVAGSGAGGLYVKLHGVEKIRELVTIGQRAPNQKGGGGGGGGGGGVGGGGGGCMEAS